MKRHSPLPMQISTRYLQFRQSADIGKILSVCHPSLLAKVSIELEDLQREEIVG